MWSGLDKSYSKRLLLEKKKTIRRLEHDEKLREASKAGIFPGTSGRHQPDSDEEKAGGFTAEGYRKHPFHKPSWGPYPSIHISQSPKDRYPRRKHSRRTMQKKIKEITGQDKEVKNKDKRLEAERSAGNVSIRNVVARLQTKRVDASTYYRDKKIVLPWLIMLIAKFSLIWEVFNYFTLVATFLLTSFTTFFTYFERDLWVWCLWLDYAFAADVLTRLSVEIWRSKNRASLVVFTTPYTLLQFFLDAFSMIPFHYIYYWIEGSSELRDLSTIDFFRLNRLIRLYRCINFFDSLKRQRRANEKLLFLFKFSNYYLAFIYFTACLLVSCNKAVKAHNEPLDYLLGNRLVSKLRHTYLEDFRQKKHGYGCKPWDIFVLTTNFATAVITTVGYGDVVPNCELEMAICIVCMLFGAIFLNGHFTGEMTNFEVDTDGARFDLYFRLREIQKFLTKVSTRPFFNAKVEEYYNYLWTYREGVYDVSFMRALPQTFHEELLFDLCKEMFDKSQFFNNLDPSFLRALSNMVSVALYNSHMILCRKGGYANKLFYILQGECQAMSKLNPDNPSGVFRAGTIIGETNLLFSFPYTTTVETRTCCQFIILKKSELLEVAEQFPVEFEIMRTRSLGKIKELYNTHQAYGVDPVCWVKARTDMENPSKPNAEKLRRNMRWGSGLNREVLEDLVDDSKDMIIFDTTVMDPSVEKDHLIPYVSCAIPEILNTNMQWIQIFNVFIMSVALWFAFFGPYCLVFGETSKLEYYVCRTQHYLNQFISFFYVLDVFVEIIGACPVEGWYYKFWDGLKVVRRQTTFYLDVLAALPLDLIGKQDQNIFAMLGTIFKVLKMWKVIRFLHYLDNVYPLQLFWFRLVQTIIVLVYGIHFIACICYHIACPFNEQTGAIVCNDESWLGSYQILYEFNYNDDDIPKEIKATTLGYENPYLYSFFYSAATLTSAGFGDFNPQNRAEMLWSIGFMLFGFYIIGYYTALLTSALACLVRPKIALQQRLVSLYQFMNHYHLRENLKNRIIEYFVLQHQFRGGVPLSQDTHIMYDAPTYLRDDVLFLEVFELLDGVPVFSKVESEVIIKLSGRMRRFIIPPNTTFVVQGEVRRMLYIIKQGSMGVFTDGKEKPTTVLEATTHFGLRDLLFGEPYHNTLRSLSYVSMYSIKRRDFEEYLQYEDDFWELVNTEKERIKALIHEMTMIYAKLASSITQNDKASVIPSWIEVPFRVDPKEQLVLKQEKKAMVEKINLVNDEYEETFKGLWGVSFIKMFLLRKTIHPAGYFSKFWNCLMSLICCFTVITLLLETFCYLRMPWFRFFQITLDVINYVDIYLKFHWCYYNPHNLILVSHPLRTAMNYILHGSFVLDIVVVAPIELVLWLFKLTTFLGYGKAATWYSRLRWIRFFQFKRIPIVFKITHDIYKNRNMILLFLYIISTLFLCTMISAIAQFIACPWQANDWEEGDEYRIPICGKNGWVAKKFEESHVNPSEISGVFRRWILGLYYVSQVILVIGFGDMITLSTADVLLLIFMCVFGFLFMRCVIADMTAAEVDSDEARAVFVENMKVLDLVMKREKVSKTLSNTVMSHLRYTWNRSRGLQPRNLFGELHPVLESELYRNLVGEKLSKVPVFKNFPKTVLSSLCRYTKTQYILRGERVMRCGNLEYSMCIIIYGKVYIADRHLNYVCSLKAGDSYGESSVIYSLPRRYNGVAACNTEVFVVTAAHYETFLERYPNFKEEMKRNLNMEKRDYFEMVLEKKMRKAKRLSLEVKQAMLANFEQRTVMVRDLIMLKEDVAESGLDSKGTRNYSRRNKYVGYGDLDDDLPLFYLTVPQKSFRKHCRIPVIHPNCGLIRRFLTIISWLCFVTPAIAAYEVCFSKEFLTSSNTGSASNSFIVSKYLHRVSGVIEWTFLVFVALQFCLAYQTNTGAYNKSLYCIVLRYITAFDGFFLDFMGCLPFIMENILDTLKVDISTFDDFWETILRNLYLLRSIRLHHYYKSQLSKKNDLDVSTFRLQITLSVTSFCLMAHMLACLFYRISPCRRPDLTNGSFKFPNLCPPPDDDLDATGWTTQFTESKGIQHTKELLEAWRWWFRSLYWVVTTISTTGFGDIVPTTINEMAVGIICIFCGAFILSIILSQFTSGMASLTKSKREYMYQVLLLVKHLTNIGLSEIRQAHIMMYFLTMWDTCRGSPYHRAIKKLPITMQIELAYALFGDTLKKVPFFKDLPDNCFIRQLGVRVTHSLYIPGTYIHKLGDPGSTLFIVYKGTVSGTIVNPSGEIEFKSIYNPGDAFGHFAALFHDGVYKKSYRAENMVEILEVKRSDISHLALKFPKFKMQITDFIYSQYEPHGTNVNIFDRKRRKAIEIGAGEELKLPKENKKQAKMAQKEKKKKQSSIQNVAKPSEPIKPSPSKRPSSQKNVKTRNSLPRGEKVMEKDKPNKEENLKESKSKEKILETSKKPSPQKNAKSRNSLPRSEKENEMEKSNKEKISKDPKLKDNILETSKPSPQKTAKSRNSSPPSESIDTKKSIKEQFPKEAKPKENALETTKKPSPPKTAKSRNSSSPNESIDVKKSIKEQLSPQKTAKSRNSSPPSESIETKKSIKEQLPKEGKPKENVLETSKKPSPPKPAKSRNSSSRSDSIEKEKSLKEQSLKGVKPKVNILEANKKKSIPMEVLYPGQTKFLYRFSKDFKGNLDYGDHTGKKSAIPEDGPEPDIREGGGMQNEDQIMPKEKKRKSSGSSDKQSKTKPGRASVGDIDQFQMESLPFFQEENETEKPKKKHKHRKGSDSTDKSKRNSRDDEASRDAERRSSLKSNSDAEEKPKRHSKHKHKKKHEKKPSVDEDEIEMDESKKKRKSKDKPRSSSSGSRKRKSDSSGSGKRRKRSEDKEDLDRKGKHKKKPFLP